MSFKHIVVIGAGIAGLTALKAFKQDPQEGTVYFCGDYLVGPNTGAALASGWFCAEKFL